MSPAKNYVGNALPRERLRDIHKHDVVIHPELMPVEYLFLRDRAEQGHNRFVEPLGHDERVARAEYK